VTTLSTWTSGTPGTATIGTSTGVPTLVADGATVITATFEGIAGTAVLTVHSGIAESITVAPATASIDVGGTQPFTATTLFSDGTKCDATAGVTWTSSAVSIATIASGGVATGVAAGTATITASAGGLFSNSATLTVTPVLTSVTVSPAFPTLDAGGCPFQLKATATYSDGTTSDVTTLSTWSSSNPSIGTVGASTGIAMAVSPGSTTISATFDGKTGTATLTGTAGTLVAISVTPSAASVAAGGTLQFSATGHWSDGSSCEMTTPTSWLSSAPGVATVSSGGLATGVTAGTTTITTSLGAVTSNPATLTVTHVLTSVTVTPDPSLPIHPGCPEQFTATATYSDGTMADVTTLSTWSSSVAAVVAIGANTGFAVGVFCGTTNITAAFGGMTSAAVALTSSCGTLVSISVTPPSALVAAGATQPFTATGTYSDATTCNITVTTSWQSSATSVATVSSGGLATAVATGSATITAIAGAVLGNATLTVP